MALNLVSNHLTKYKADTSQHRNELKKLSGAQKKAFKEQMDAMDAQNRKIDDQIAMWGKLAAGVAAIAGAFKLAQAGIASYQENSRVMAGAAGADLNGLRKATLGLVEDTDLLRSASKLMNGTFALNNQEMQIAMRGALALRKRMGIDLKEAMERVSQAINEANAEALKPLGITIKATSGDAETQKLILAELDKQYQSLGGNVKVAGDEMASSTTGFANAVDNAKFEIGRMAVEMEPLLQALTGLVGLIADALKYINAIPDWLVPDDDGVDRVLGMKHATDRRLSSLIKASDTKDGTIDAQIAAAEAAARSRWATEAKKKIGGAKSAVVMEMDGMEVFVLSENDLAIRAGIIDAVRQDALKANMGLSMSALADGGSAGDLSFSGGSFGQNQESAMAAAQAGQQSQLAQMFGPLEEFNAYREAFDMLTGASMAAFDAWITGSKSAGEAFQAFIADALRALAKELGIQALKHGAYALGSLAFMDFRGAGQHAAAAAAFGVGAVAAGGAAHYLQPARSSGSASIPSGAQAGNNLGRGSGGAQTNVWVLGEHWDDLNPREREASARRFLSRAGVTLEGQAVTRG